jgi:hypothetical protein
MRVVVTTPTAMPCALAISAKVRGSFSGRLAGFRALIGAKVDDADAGFHAGVEGRCGPGAVGVWALVL